MEADVLDRLDYLVAEYVMKWVRLQHTESGSWHWHWEDDKGDHVMPPSWSPTRSDVLNAEIRGRLASLNQHVSAWATAEAGWHVDILDEENHRLADAWAPTINIAVCMAAVRANGGGQYVP